MLIEQAPIPATDARTAAALVSAPSPGDPAASGVFDVRPAGTTDRWIVSPIAHPGARTGAAYVLYSGAIAFLVREAAAWEHWAGGRGHLPDPQPATSRVAEQIDLVQRATGWSDRELSDAFPGAVARETVNRWKRQTDPNLKTENAYRLAVLARLAESLDRAGLDSNWLRQPVQGSTDTPYQLICKGRLADVQQAIDLILAGDPATSAMPQPASSTTWDEHVDDDDDGEWLPGESDALDA